MAESARSRRQLVDEAGWRRTSPISVLAGTLVAFGAVALVAAAAGAAGSALGLDTNGISTHEWRQSGIAAGAIGALVLFVAFFFGGYSAGRMSRRAGARHGALVFLLSALLIGVIALIAWAVRDSVNLDIASNLRDNGVPTDRNTWGDIGLGVGIAAGAAMLLGSIAGGIRGDRWHGRLATAVVERRDAAREEAAREDAAREDVRAETGDEVHAPAERDDWSYGSDWGDRRDRTEVVDVRDHEPSLEEERDHTRPTTAF